MARRYTPRPLRCQHCGAGFDHITVAGAGNSRRTRGIQRRAQHCRCSACGHEWWSIAPAALERGREADAQAQGSVPPPDDAA